MKNRLRRIGQLTCLLMLALGSIAISFLPRVSAGIAMTQVTPQSGTVGTQVQVIGNLTTVNGNFNLLFDSTVVANGTALVNNVTTTFTVPSAAQGNHNLKLVDLTSNETTTTIFIVLAAYSIEAVTTPKSFQEGDQIPVLTNVTGEVGNSTENANVTVVAPDNTTYTAISTFPISSIGNGNAIANYPANFSVGANTKLVGVYVVYLNGTLASGNFAVGLTNSTQYHRGETVNVKALYLPGENVTVSIAGKGINNGATISDPTGLISFNWSVPTYASIGSYAVKVVSTEGPTLKSVDDLQNFTVPGFAINVTAKNLANDTVANIVVTAYENGTLADNRTTSSTGLAILTLEVGNFDCTAISSGQEVGEVPALIGIDNSTLAFDLVCNLTNLRIHVVSLLNGSEVDVPEVGLNITTVNKTVTTGINGSVVVGSLLPNATYVLNVTRYDASFNITTLQTLLVNDAPAAWFDLKINCPNSTLQVTVTKAGGGNFSGALVRIQESLGVPIIETSTNASGVATFSAPFGEYKVDVLDTAGERLNGTTVDLFGDQAANVSCGLYGLTVSVRVVDYFGQGIANMNVSLVRNGQTQAVTSTGPGGTVTFDNVIGGQLDIIVSSNGASTPIASQSIDVETLTSTNQISVGKYVVLAGMLVETSVLATAILMILVVVLILALEVYRRRRLSVQKAESKITPKES